MLENRSTSLLTVHLKIGITIATIAGRIGGLMAQTRKITLIALILVCTVLMLGIVFDHPKIIPVKIMLHVLIG
jgi:hypothetical protein